MSAEILNLEEIARQLRRIGDLLESVTSDSGYILVKDVNHE